MTSLRKTPSVLSGTEHTLMFSGVFLITEVVAVGVVTLLDFFLINLIIIPLEDRDLERRFGEEYRIYRRNVPRFFPVRYIRDLLK